MAIKKNICCSDELRIKGIRSLGYGQMPKIVMLDSSLSLEAKAIYAYFCSYTGNGNNTAFPGRDRILHDLHMTKTPYYRYMSQLTDNGYITVEQSPGNSGNRGFKHNIYTLENFPNKFGDAAPEGASEFLTKAYTQIRNAKDISAAGYGTVPKVVMISDIPVAAKGVYAYFCVFSGADYESCPSRDTILYHLNISPNSFIKYTKALVDANLISKVQSTSNGKFGSVVYHLNQNAQDKIAEKKTEAVASPYTKNWDTLKWDTSKRDTLKSDMQKWNTNNPNVNKTKNNNTDSYQSRQSSQSISPDANSPDDDLIERNENEILKELTETKQIPDDICCSSKALTSLIRNLTDWNDRTEDGFYDNEVYARVYRMFVDCLSEMMANNAETYVQGAHISGAQVRSALENSYLEFVADLTGEEYATLGFLPDKVCSNFLAAAEKRKISNQRAYLKAVIWTTLQSIGSFS